MKTQERILLIVSLALVVLALTGTVLSRYWVNAPLTNNLKKEGDQGGGLVDEQPLVTAQRLASIAATLQEQEFAQNALRIADHEVDLAFASALRGATMHAAQLSPAARPIMAKIQDLQAQIKAEQDDVAHLKTQLAKAADAQKTGIQGDLELQGALLEVSQEELEGAQQELARAGGDPRAAIQSLQDQHEAAHQLVGSGAMATMNAMASASTNSQPAPELTQSRSGISQFRAWWALNAKSQELTHAREELTVRQEDLNRQHTVREQAAKGDAPAQPANGQQTSGGGAGASSGLASQDSGSSTLVSTLKRVADAQKNLSELDKRVQDLQQLDDIYGNWGADVKGRKRAFVVGLLEAGLWVTALLLLVYLADPLFQTILGWFGAESRRLNNVRVAGRFAVQVAGVALALLVIFGIPSQLATVVALAGAGLTVALKDFIVGFIGWFTLMGPNGIRPGDWVEIDGVGGEVLEIGPLHTILLETGSWTDAGHPTGRKVSIVNSYAIEGHFFNFSTTGQWLWDEIQVPVPSDVEPQPIIDAIQKIVVAETEANARQADQEWQHVVSVRGKHPFSAAPSISVQPTSGGINVLIRYITRPMEWRDRRSRLYRQIIEILRAKHIPEPPPVAESPGPQHPSAVPQ
jgi:small-conductance mechanosensitive channel